MKTLGMLSSGFILTSLVWAWSLAKIIDRRLTAAASVMLLAGIMTLFGVIHSPLPGNQLFVPLGPESWGDMVLGSESRWHVLEFAAGYFASALLLFGWSYFFTDRSTNSRTSTTMMWSFTRKSASSSATK